MDSKQLDMIVRQVVEALKAQGVSAPSQIPSPFMQPVVAASASSSGVRKPAAARREFTPAGNPVLTVPGKSPSSNKATSPKQFAKVFVTADMLQQRVSSNGQSATIELATNEFLTPNAQELAEIKHWTVLSRKDKPLSQKAPAQDAPAQPASSCCASAPVQATSAGQPSSGAVGIVVAKAGDKVSSILSAIANDGASLVDFSATDCWMKNLSALCSAITAGQVCLGVVMLPYAADAIVLANKVKGIRAVQGTRADSVASAVRHMGANVLILEHAFSTFHEMRQMVRLFTAHRDAPTSTQLVERLAKLEGCQCESQG